MQVVAKRDAEVLIYSVLPGVAVSFLCVCGALLGVVVRSSTGRDRPGGFVN